MLKENPKFKGLFAGLRAEQGSSPMKPKTFILSSPSIQRPLLGKILPTSYLNASKMKRHLKHKDS